jgi:glutaredoxin
MKDIKVRVLRLGGCGWCEEISKRLVELGIEFESIDADKEEELADRVESLLDTLLYPIIIVERPADTWYVFRPSHEREINKVVTIGPSHYKVGYNTIIDIIETVAEILK